MKKIFLLGLVLFFSFNFYGQDSNSDSSKKPFFGFKAGFNYFKQGSSEISNNNKYKGGFGYQLGTTLNIPMS